MRRILRTVIAVLALLAAAPMAASATHADAEATRVDYAPWVIGAVALITLAVVLIWRRRRNTTIV